MILLLRELLETGRIRLYATLALASAVSYGMLAWRMAEYDSLGFAFLAPNLILAAIPFAVSQVIVVRPKLRVQALLPVLFVWLLFLPNAPYLITDVMHLRSASVAPIWFDTLMVLSFAWTGLMLGYLSLFDIHTFVEWRYGRRLGWVFSGAALVLASLGVYMGRFLRWNSWDVFTQPATLLRDIASRFLHPATEPNVYVVTLAFSIFLGAGYLLLRSRILLGTDRASADKLEDPAS